ncbi:MAG: DsrE family protein [Deltaproteobacteria bacterium]|nr:DsrE family protein [Deltaproteobacteria bacterium]MBW2051300.1 DsrE family protein [Deltaproteobacteria bacterium]MBW2141345.1 DsrE family protein [Deltaproteobacteria bacterium]MBW2322994.1 DsrE family protein [Deltaproteobacteria bacterium]
MIDSICVIVTRPQGEERSALGIRTSWATLQSAIVTKILFVENGVYSLLKNPGYNAAMLRDFIDEDGEVYCTKGSLDSRGLSEENLVDGIKVIPEEQVAALIEDCESVAVF